MQLTHACSHVDLIPVFVGPLLLFYFSQKQIKQIFRPTLANVPLSPSHPGSLTS